MIAVLLDTKQLMCYCGQCFETTCKSIYALIQSKMGYKQFYRGIYSGEIEKHVCIFIMNLLRSHDEIR